jgi:phenylacetate-CoA ligase
LNAPLAGLRAVQTSAETLTAEHRGLIEEAFGAPAYNRYGCREVGNLAHECDAHAGLHLLIENNIVEVLKADGSAARPGEAGDVVVTNLWNTATPLIRYRLGDVARVGDAATCACGRSAPRLEAVLGRTSDIIATPSGKMLHGEFFTHLFYGAPVRRFQVEQTSLHDLHVRVVPDKGYRPEVGTAIAAQITRHADQALKVRWEEVEEIPASASGKYRFTISSLRRAS